eukprot:jgi/Undpi1/11884/HiC_scaffold_4.g01583.m1
MKVPQWRKDVLEWADKRGYKETGGGLWGELDGESAENLTRPTRYFVLTRDLLTDTRLAGTFGDGTARFAAATAAAAERAAVAADSKCAPNSASVEAALDAKTTATRGSSVRKDGEKEDENTRLAGFLSRVLKGMTDAEQLSEGASDAGSVKRNAAAPVADMSITTESTANSREPGRVPHPPLPPAAHDIQAADMAFSTAGAPSPSSPSVSGQPTLSGTSASAAAAASSGTLFCDGPGEIFEEVCEPIAAGDDEEKEESIENLLGSLVRALNTTQGRADFGRLVAESSGN